MTDIKEFERRIAQFRQFSDQTVLPAVLVDELFAALKNATELADVNIALVEVAAKRNARLRDAIEDATEVMDQVRMFVCSRSRIKKPEGEEWYEGAIKALRKALEGE